MIWKQHHSFCDGASVISFVMSGGDKYDTAILFPIKKVTFKQKLLLNLGVPFYLPLIFFKLILAGYKPNPLHDGVRNLSGIKKVATSQDFLLSDVKAAAKNKGVTINDLMTSSLSATVKETFEAMGDKTSDTIRIVIPANIRWAYYPTAKDVKLENKFAVVPLDIPLRRDMDEALKVIPKATWKLRSAFGEVFAIYVLSKISMTFLPYFLTNNFLNSSTKPFTLAFSNTPGFLKPVHAIGGYYINVTSYVQTSSHCGLTISAISYVDHIKVTCVADDTVIPTHQEVKKFINIFERNIINCYPTKTVASVKAPSSDEDRLLSTSHETPKKKGYKPI